MALRNRQQAQASRWLEHRRGGSRLIIVAPHGGRRRRPIRRGDGVNDLHTAEIARELAERLDAHAIINESLDRNEVDLNRISDLCTAAPEFLTCLVDAVEVVRSEGRIPLVLFVHGWNMVLPGCDLGFGVRARGGRLRGKHPTLSQACYRSSVLAISRELACRGLDASIGLRYPGSAADNALQMFSGRHAASSDARVAELSRLAAAGWADALQMELAIPLRWPGPRRRTFVESIVAALGDEEPVTRGTHGHGVEATAERAAQPARPASGAGRARSRAPTSLGAAARREWNLEPPVSVGERRGPRAPGANLQAVLEVAAGSACAAGASRAGGTKSGVIGVIGLFAGVEPSGGDGFAARICLVRNDGTMLLFVTEAEWDGEPGRFRGAGLDWSVGQPASTGATTTVRYHGPMVAYENHDAYEDLEAGLVTSVLSEVNITLHFTSEADLVQAGSAAGAFGRLAYALEIDGAYERGEVFGVLDRRSRRSPACADTGRVFVTTGVERPLAAFAPHDVVFHTDACGRVERIELSVGRERRLIGEVTARVPVWRPAADGTFVRLTFGLARLSDAGQGSDGEADGEPRGVIHALYDRVEIVRRDG